MKNKRFFRCLNKKKIDFLETRNIEKKKITSLSNHALNNLNKNNL